MRNNKAIITKAYTKRERELIQLILMLQAANSKG